MIALMRSPIMYALWYEAAGVPATCIIGQLGHGDGDAPLLGRVRDAVDQADDGHGILQAQQALGLRLLQRMRGRLPMGVLCC